MKANIFKIFQLEGTKYLKPRSHRKLFLEQNFSAPKVLVTSQGKKSRNCKSLSFPYASSPGSRMTLSHVTIRHSFFFSLINMSI